MAHRIKWGVFIFFIVVLIIGFITWWIVKKRRSIEQLPVHNRPQVDNYVRRVLPPRPPLTAVPRHPPPFVQQAKVLQRESSTLTYNNFHAESHRYRVSVPSPPQSPPPKLTPPTPLNLRPPSQINLKVSTEVPIPPSREDPSSKEPGATWRVLADTEYEKKRELIVQRRTKDRWASSAIDAEIKTHQALADGYNVRAANEIFSHHNGKYVDSLSGCDLHGLHVSEAEQFMEKHLEKCRENGISSTRIITGRGKHTADGVAKIRPRMLDILESQDEVRIVEKNVGDFLVKIV